MRTFRIVYTGPVRGAHTLAGTLRQDGLEVDWTPPEEQRGAFTDALAGTVTAELIVKGITATVNTAIAKARERFGDGAKVEIEDDGDKTE